MKIIFGDDYSGQDVGIRVMPQLEGVTSALSFPRLVRHSSKSDGGKRESSVSISATGGSACGMRIILDSRAYFAEVSAAGGLAATFLRPPQRASAFAEATADRSRRHLSCSVNNI